MKGAKIIILSGVVAAVCFCDVALAQVPTLPPDGGFRLGGPSCATYDRELQPSGSFRPDDEVTVRGGGFPSGSLVLVTFRQLPYESELGRFKAGASGEFTSEPRIIRIPAEGVRGPAAIVASTESGYTATCQLALAAPVSAARTAKPARERDDGENENLSWWLIVWATLVAVAAGGLAYLRYRRWVAARLERRISGLIGGGHVPPTESPPMPPVHPAPPAPPPPLSPWGPDERPTLAVTPDPFLSPPILPPGWDDGREPTPVKFQ